MQRSWPIHSLFRAFALSLILSSCARPKTLTAELQPRLLKANNLEETVTLRDEVMLAYTLTSYDARNQPVLVVNGAWGVESMKQGQQAALERSALPIQLPMPKGGRVVASVVLIEVDDYAKSQQLLERIRKVHNYVATPAAVLAVITDVLTPLKYVTAGLMATGVSLQAADKLDEDDVLGQSSAELRDGAERVLNVPARFEGRHLRDKFNYELAYDVALKRVTLRGASPPVRTR